MSRSRVILSAAAVTALVGASVLLGSLSAAAYTPPAPVITSGDRSIADNGPVTISGTAEHLNGVDQAIDVYMVSGETTTLYCSASIFYYDSISAEANWDCTGAGGLPYGQVVFYAVQYELATPAEESEQSNPVLYRIGSSDPGVITAPTSGSSTLDSTPVFSGTGPRLGYVIVQLPGGRVQLCSSFVDEFGNWSCESEQALSSSDGTSGDTEETYTVVVVAQRVDSIWDGEASPTDVTILQPTTPSVNQTFGPPWVTGAATPTVNGSMGPETANVTVWISQDNLNWVHYCNVPTSSPALTVWTCNNPEEELALGDNYIAVSSQNEYGNQSTASPSIIITRVPTPTITSIPAGGYTNDSTPVIAGLAPFGDTIQAYKFSGPSPDTYLCNAPIVAGAFSCESELLPDGEYSIHVYTLEGVDMSSGALEFTVDTVAPVIPVITTSGETTDTTPVISGTGEPGATIIVYRDGAPAACSNAPVMVDGAGNWSCQTATALTPGGTYSWAATQQDAAGNLSEAGVPAPQTTLTILAPPPPPPAAPAAPLPTPTPTPSPTVPAPLAPQPWTFEFSAGGGEFERGDTTELTGSGLPPAALVEAEFHSTPVFLGSTSVSDAGEFSLPVTIPDDATAGVHEFVVTITPAEGLPSTQRVPVTIVVHPKALGGPDGSSSLPFVGQASAEGAERADPAAPSSLTRSIDTLQDVLSNPAVIGGAAIAGFVLLLLVAFPAELLNSTISENYDRLTRGRIPRAPWWQRVGAWMQRTPLFGGIGLTLAAAVIFGFADPNFGFDITSLRLVLACAIALFIVGYLASSLSGAIIRRRWGLATTIELKPLGLVLAVVGVVLSRLIEFTPGFLLGLLIGISVVGTTTAAQRAKTTLVQAGVVFALAILGWVGFSLLSAVSAPDSFVTALAFDSLVAVTVEGLTALFIGLLPVKLLDGPAIFEYSKWLWALVYALVAAAFVLIVVPASWGEIDGPLWVWLAVLAGFAAVSLAVYLFFRFTGGDDDDEPQREESAEKESIPA